MMIEWLQLPYMEILVWCWMMQRLLLTSLLKV